MSLLTPYLHTSASVYDITTEESESGQPIESLSLSKTIRVFYEPHSYRSPVYNLFPAGQIKTGDFLCVTDKIVTVNQVLLINSVYYRVVESFELNVQKINIGWQLSLELYQH